jgi:signal peptidase I
MKKLKALLREYRGLLLFVSLLMVFRTTYADWSPVPTGSMEPTIVPGDVVWVDKTTYGPSVPFLNKRLFTWGHPQRGDIITFVPPVEDTLYVKRVMAVPGDTIRIEGYDIYVNGVRLEQSLVEATDEWLIGNETIDGKEHAFKVSADKGISWLDQAVVVPEGKLFVMGDHRNNSGDSRSWGFADEANVTGKVSNIAVSFSGERTGRRVGLHLQ